MTWTTILSAMLFLLPPRQNDVPRLKALVIQSVIIERTCGEDAWCDSVLISVAHFESGFTIHARGKLGEVGPWQLLGVRADLPLKNQAALAWYRWKAQKPWGYTGEGHCPCPLAQHRLWEAELIWGVYSKVQEIPL